MQFMPDHEDSEALVPLSTQRELFRRTKRSHNTSVSLIFFIHGTCCICQLKKRGFVGALRANQEMTENPSIQDQIKSQYFKRAIAVIADTLYTRKPEGQACAWNAGLITTIMAATQSLARLPAKHWKALQNA